MGFSMIEKLSKKLAELREQDKGMSLIELVVVVAILAVLVAIAIPAYLGVVDDAKRSAVQSQLQNAYTVYSFQVARGASAAAAAADAAALGTVDIPLSVHTSNACITGIHGSDTNFQYNIILASNTTTPGTITPGACS